MIPGKILVYRAPEGTKSEVYRTTRRRKKSLGDLYQNGYRVKAGQKGETPGWKQSLSLWYRKASYWGKFWRISLSSHTAWATEKNHYGIRCYTLIIGNTNYILSLGFVIGKVWITGDMKPHQNLFSKANGNTFLKCIYVYLRNVVILLQYVDIYLIINSQSSKDRSGHRQ